MRAAVYYFNKESGKWAPADKGLSRVSLYKIGPVEGEGESFVYKVVAISIESNEVVVNTQINSSSFSPKKVEPLFYQWVDESSLIIGLNFASPQEYSDFVKEVDAIITEPRKKKKSSHSPHFTFLLLLLLSLSHRQHWKRFKGVEEQKIIQKEHLLVPKIFWSCSTGQRQGYKRRLNKKAR